MRIRNRTRAKLACIYLNAAGYDTETIVSSDGEDLARGKKVAISMFMVNPKNCQNVRKFWVYVRSDRGEIVVQVPKGGSWRERKFAMELVDCLASSLPKETVTMQLLGEPIDNQGKGETR